MMVSNDHWWDRGKADNMVQDVFKTRVSLKRLFFFCWKLYQNQDTKQNIHVEQLMGKSIQVKVILTQQIVAGLHSSFPFLGGLHQRTASWHIETRVILSHQGTEFILRRLSRPVQARTSSAAMTRRCIYEHGGKADII